MSQFCIVRTNRMGQHIESERLLDDNVGLPETRLMQKCMNKLRCSQSSQGGLDPVSVLVLYRPH